MKVKEISRKVIVLLTKGKDGCSIIEKGKEFEIPSRPLPQNDPTGAGDFFLGGFAYGILKGYSLERCAQIANYCGGLVVGTVGVPTKTKNKGEFPLKAHSYLPRMVQLQIEKRRIGEAVGD